MAPTIEFTQTEVPNNHDISTEKDFTFNGCTSPALPELNIGQLLDRSLNYARKTALVSRWQNKRLTYEALYSSCRHIAHNLLAHGVRPGDHVVVLAGNSIEYAQLFFASGAIGAVFSIINPTFTVEETVAAVEFLEPVAIFVADRIGYRKNDGLLDELVKRKTGASLIVRLGECGQTSGTSVLNWREFIDGSADDHYEELVSKVWAKAHPDDTLCVQFTSGTTGPRKAAMLSHRNLLCNAFLVGERLQYTANDIVCCCTPLFHCFALVCGVIAPVIYGSTAVIPSDVFLAGASLEALSDEKCSVILAVATMFQAMLDHPDAGKHAAKIRLRTGIVAGSSLSRTMLQRISDDFGFTGLTYGYGMTEASCIVFLTDSSQVLLIDDHSSVGTLLSQSSARVVDSNLSTLPPGCPGELLLSGYLVFKGYYKNEAKTEETLIRDHQGRNWLRTGDTVTINKAGRCTITGRVKDMIKRGGENIFPSDVEKVLETHPSIAAAACIGIPDDYWGEIVGVFLQRVRDPQSSTTVGDKDVKLWLRKRVASHKMPEHFFWVGDGDGVPNELPFNHTGKLMKGELRSVASNLVQARKYL